MIDVSSIVKDLPDYYNLFFVGVTPLMLSVLYNHPIITEYFHTCGLSDTKNAFRQTSIDLQNYLNFNMSSPNGMSFFSKNF